MLIINANIKTMEEEDFENGYIAVFDGKIQSVGPMSCLLYTSRCV